MNQTCDIVDALPSKIYSCGYMLSVKTRSATWLPSHVGYSSQNAPQMLLAWFERNPALLLALRTISESRLQGAITARLPISKLTSVKITILRLSLPWPSRLTIVLPPSHQQCWASRKDSFTSCCPPFKIGRKSCVIRLVCRRSYWHWRKQGKCLDFVQVRASWIFGVSDFTCRPM